VRFLLSGSAPLDPKIGEFLKICFCCQVLEGYGLTENMAGACLTNLDETQLGHAGRVLCCNEIKLVEVMESGHSPHNNPPTGEICIRGSNVFKGYYKDPDKTKEAIEPDGWFHSGDVGRWNGNGTLSIIDRKKNIFKLAQGEYVAVEYLEGVYARSSFVDQIWVYGNSFKRYLVCIVVPSKDNLLKWASDNVVAGDYQALGKHPLVNKVILEDLTKVGKAQKLHGFEFVKGVCLSSEPFSVDNELMTATFKLRRPQLLKFFQQQIDGLYQSIPETD